MCSRPATMSEVKPPTQGAVPPQTCAWVIFVKTWTAMRLAPGGNAGGRVRACRVVSGGDAGDMRAVNAVGQRAGRRGARSNLLIRTVGTERLRDAGLGRRETGFGGDVAGKERMRTVHTGV